MSERLRAAFAGPVTCSVSGRLLLLNGVERGNGRPLRVWLAGFDGPAPPANCPDAELYEQSVPSLPAWRLSVGSWSQMLPGRSLHLHRPFADRFFAAVPTAVCTVRARVGWALLLNLLRAPGAATLLKFFRSR